MTEDRLREDRKVTSVEEVAAEAVPLEIEIEIEVVQEVATKRKKGIRIK
jgi:hypothetical protein